MSGRSCVLLIAGERPSGQPLYAYFVLPCNDFDAFMDARAEGKLMPEEFGTVLEAGEGLPTPNARRVAACKWGFEDGEELPVLDDELVAELVEAVRVGTVP